MSEERKLETRGRPRTERTKSIRVTLTPTELYDLTVLAAAAGKKPVDFCHTAITEEIKRRK